MNKYSGFVRERFLTMLIKVQLQLPVTGMYFRLAMLLNDHLIRPVFI